LNIIVGTYECKVDAKGSAVTSAFEKQLTLFFKAVSFEAFCFSTLSEIISHGRMGYNDGELINWFVKNNDFIRRFTAGVKVVDIDSLGGVLILKI
jgi:MraZ protein